MTETTARRWALAAAAGVIGNGLLAAFNVSCAMQDFGDPRGVAASLGSAADYAGILQNLLLVAVRGDVVPDVRAVGRQGLVARRHPERHAGQHARRVRPPGQCHRRRYRR
jgi:hypothetical protein